MDNFVGREEDIRNITGYLDFTTSDVQVVHIVGPPGFGKSTLAKKVGEKYLRKRVNVHYVDVRQRMVKDVDTLSETIVLAMVESRRNRVKLSDLEDKLRKTHSETLIILDNCDELFEYANFLKLLTHQKNIRFLLTSQRHKTDIYVNIQLHAIYNLSSEAALQFLGKVAPILTYDQKMEITHLTGNIPLALDVVGAIFKFPDAPSAESVIQGLRDNPLQTLTPTEIHTNFVDISIGLAYSYLKPELKQLCVNLSHFPGSFGKDSALSFFKFSKDMLDELVQRSLVQSSHGRQRYYFHQLLRTFFLSQEESDLLNFDTQFQHYFTGTLEIIISEVSFSSKLTTLDHEKHNIVHMFTLFKSAKSTNITFTGIYVTLCAIEMNVLQMRFLPVEIYGITRDMLSALETYTPHEQAMVTSFLETYVKVVKLVAQHQWSVHKANAIKTLNLRRKRIDEGYERNLINVTTFTEYFNLLAQYYKGTGEDGKAASCDTHILNTIHGQLKHCSPDCDYLSISVAYENIGDRMQAFEFRKLAYQHQLQSLKPMEKAKLILDLYNDYSNETVGNDKGYASTLSVMVIDEIYPYLITADRSQYSERTLYVAITFFAALNMEDYVVSLQQKMIDNEGICNCVGPLKQGKYFKQNVSLVMNLDELKPLCEFKCAAHYADIAQEAYERKCYKLAIWAGEQSYANLDKLGESYTVLKFEPSSLIARSHYDMGNISGVLIWLKIAVQHTSDAIRHKYLHSDFRSLRLGLCLLTLKLSLMSFQCYFRILRDVVYYLLILPFVVMLHPFSWNFTGYEEKMTLSAETGLTEQKYHFIWSQFSTVHTPNFVEQWINAVIFVAPFVGALLYYCILCCVCWCLKCCCRCCCICTRSRAIITVTIVIVLFSIDWF